MKNRNWGIMATVLLMLTACMTACGSSGKNTASEMQFAAFDNAAYDAAGSYDYVASNTAAPATAAAADMDYEAAYAEEGYIENDTSSGGLVNENSNASNRKLIKTVDMSVETEKYDDLLVNLTSQIKQLGGYIEYQYEYNGRTFADYEYSGNRNANWTVRIPTARFDEFVVQVDESTNITNKTERVTDVTLQYVDLESHKSALLAEQKRLLELVENADTIEEIITIEQRLSDVRYEIESMESQLRMLNDQIDYSTINLNIQEVKRVTAVVENPSVWDRIKKGFSESSYSLGEGLVNLFVWFIVNIPYLVVWAIVIVVGIVVVKKIIKRKDRKKEKIQQQPVDDMGKKSEDTE